MTTPGLTAPAAGLPYKLVQPDGATLTAVTRGDEWFHWVETLDGYPIHEDATGYWRYVRGYDGKRPLLSLEFADRAPSAATEKLKKSEIRPRSALYPPTPSLKSLAKATSNSGVFSGHLLFILVQFSNQAGFWTEGDWSGLLNIKVPDYYAKASNGMVTLTPALDNSGIPNNGVAGWYTLPYGHPDPGPDQFAETSILNRRQVAVDAIQAASSDVDFSSYDANGDGFVDAGELAIVLVLAGYDEAYGATLLGPSVWSIAESIPDGSAPQIDGTVFVGADHSGAGGYVMIGELLRRDTQPRQNTLGVIAHELGHLIFNLPDLYDKDLSTAGIGAFGLMGWGVYGKKSTDTYLGETPVLPSAWTKLTLGWVEAGKAGSNTVITASGSAAATRTNSVYRISTGSPDEYFLIENRRTLGYDRGLERDLGPNAGGIAIWHIDDSKASDDNDNQLWVDLEEADGTPIGSLPGENIRGKISDLWYPGNATDFNSNTIPGSTLASGSASHIAIKILSPTGEFMNLSGVNTASALLSILSAEDE